ncbi:MAG: hypothetical protein KatS3mg130_1363 [Candidatus Sumerlaea sp.]|nr:MAG: hypothetical protein KatS3mg130_1363 [Candidatus Sumerlaea sp.]
MKSRTVGKLIVLIVVVAAGAFGFPAAYHWLILNKAQFLINQQKWTEAQTLIESVDRPGEVAGRAARLLATVNMHTGRFREALELLSYQPRVASVVFDQAICLYELDQEDQAREAFREVCQKVEELPEPLQMLAVAGSAILGGEVLAFEEEMPEGLPRAYRIVWHSLQARAAFQMLHLEKALDLARIALSRGDQNNRTRRIALALAAMRGDFALAQSYADALEQPVPLLQQALSEMVELETHVTTKSISVEVAQAILKQRREIARGKAWVLSQLGQRQPQTTGVEVALEWVQRVLETNPEDLLTGLLTADLLAALHREREAYAWLQSLLARMQVYRVYVRARDLAGEPLDNLEEQELFGDYSRIVKWVSAEELVTTGGIAKEQYLAFYTRGECGFEFEAPATGIYRISVTAKGDCAFGLCPRVKVWADDHPLEEIYIAREGWDCYSIARSLERGKHLIRLEYINNSERLLSKEEDRNLYIHNVIVTKTESD